MTETPEERARRLGLTQNTDPAQARARRLGLVPNQEPEPSWDERIAAPLRSAYQTATFGLGNKLTAMTRAALPQALGGTEGFDYSGALSDERQKMESFRRRHPYIDAAAGAAGAVAPLILTGGTGTPMALKSLAGAPAAAPTVAGSARAGGAFGAMYGAGEGDNTTVEQTLENAVRGGIAGATLAGGLHAGGTSAAKLMDYAGVRPSGRESGVAGRVANLAGVKSQEERALETVLEKFRRAGMAPRDALAVSNEATRIGKPEMVEGGRMTLENWPRDELERAVNWWKTLLDDKRDRWGRLPIQQERIQNLIKQAQYVLQTRDELGQSTMGIRRRYEEVVMEDAR